MKSQKKRFDELILNNLKENGIDKFGYKVKGNSNSEPLYYDNKTFDAFKNEMAYCYPAHYNKYWNGHGSELKETSSPPKMASVASSSRFAYLALRGGAQAIGGSENVDFEHECRINGIRGTAPQLDAYTTDKRGNPIYVEVKCHEIFDKHKVRLKAAYSKNICGTESAFGLPADLCKSTDKEFSIPLYNFKIKSENSMVDIKQLMCHLMGIADQKEKDRKETATLAYLFFKPVVSGENADFVDDTFCRLLQEIECVFHSQPIRNFCRNKKINLQVVIQESVVMEKLTDKNIGYFKVYPYDR